MTQPITCADINKHMTGGGCPTAGSIGECAAIGQLTADTHEASLFIWDPTFYDSAKVAGWFHALGATRVWVQAVLYSDCNGDRDSFTPEGSRMWVVTFEQPAGAA